MKFDCLLCGVGGQGTILSSRFLAHAAMRKGLFARTAETIGMAQRGGSVVSHVRIGDTHSPLIEPGCADLLLGLEPGEAVRRRVFLRDGGAIVVADEALTPVTASLSGKHYDARAMIEALAATCASIVVVSVQEVRAVCGTDRALNVAALGAASASGALPFTLAELENSIMETLNPRVRDMNLRALKLGAEFAKG